VNPIGPPIPPRAAPWLGVSREIRDPEAEMQRLAEARKVVPAAVADETHQLRHDGKVYFLRVKVMAEPAEAPEPGSFPWFPVRADLGRRIADLVRADCAEAAGDA
jgi:hypothetical protein